MAGLDGIVSDGFNARRGHTIAVDADELAADVLVDGGVGAVVADAGGNRLVFERAVGDGLGAFGEHFVVAKFVDGVAVAVVARSRRLDEICFASEREHVESVGRRASERFRDHLFVNAVAERESRSGVRRNGSHGGGDRLRDGGGVGSQASVDGGGAARDSSVSNLEQSARCGAVGDDADVSSGGAHHVAHYATDGIGARGGDTRGIRERKVVGRSVRFDYHPFRTGSRVGESLVDEEVSGIVGGYGGADSRQA